MVKGATESASRMRRGGLGARTVRRVLVAAHAWVGFAASLVLAVVAATGTALVFKDDWIRATVPGATDEPVLDAAALASVAEAAERAFGADRVAAVKFATPDLGVHRVYLTDGGGAYLDGSGAVVAEWGENERLEDWLLDLHFKLLAGTNGEAVVGALGLVALMLAVSGVYLWWPSRASYRARLVPRSAERRELLGTHRDTGAWAAVPVIVLSLSGAAMIFHDASARLLGALFGRNPDVSVTAAANALPGGDVDWTDVLARGEERFPAAPPRIASWPSADDPSVVVRYKQPSEWHPNGRSTLHYDPAARQVLGVADASAFGLGLKIHHAMYPLHAARIGGPLWAGVVAITGAAMTSLAVLGAWSFLLQRRRGQERRRGAQLERARRGIVEDR